MQLEAAIGTTFFGELQGTHFCSPAKKRSNSGIGIRTWRNARLGLIRPRFISRRIVTVETPPRYWAASLIFSAPFGADIAFMRPQFAWSAAKKSNRSQRFRLRISERDPTLGPRLSLVSSNPSTLSVFLTEKSPRQHFLPKRCTNASRNCARVGK